MDFLLIVGTLSIAAVTAVLVPMLLQVRRTAQKTELLVDSLNRETAPLLKSLSDTTNELRIVATSVNRDLSKVEAVVDTLQKSGNLLMGTTAMLKKSVIPVAAQIGGVGAGVRTFIQYLCK